MRDAMMVASKRNSLDNNTSTVDARTAKRDEELTIYGFQKDSTIMKGAMQVVQVVGCARRLTIFYGSRVPKAEKNAENKTNNIQPQSGERGLSAPAMGAQDGSRELHRSELARDRSEAKFRRSKSDGGRSIFDEEETHANTIVRLLKLME